MAKAVRATATKKKTTKRAAEPKPTAEPKPASKATRVRGIDAIEAASAEASAAAEEKQALAMDKADPLRKWRDEFVFPTALGTGKGAKRQDCVYLVGNSLGLMPKGARGFVEQELEDWEQLGVEAHLQGRRPWYSYHEQFREIGARLVGAQPGEVVMMNSLTVNLHLMMVSFYQPTNYRYKIVVEDATFPSDSYAVASHAGMHGFDPAEAVVRLRPRPGEASLRTEDILDFLRQEGQSVALVMLGAVNYLTGQWFRMQEITEAAHRAGAVVGWDLAHAAGSVPMHLHDWDVDFAVWCSYKYLNAGPGAVAGCFVHERHGKDTGIPRLAGWWGNDPATRFRMEPEFVAREGADGWQLSNPPILAMAPLLASLKIFDEVGMEAIREKSLKLTTYMGTLIMEHLRGRIEILTPRDDEDRGGHLSLAVRPVEGGGGEGGATRELFEKLLKAGVVCDFREPNVIRAAPAALYCSFHDVWRFVRTLRDLL